MQDTPSGTETAHQRSEAAGDRDGVRLESGASRRTNLGPAGWFGIWAIVNLALGVVIAYPLLFLFLIGLHARAMVFDRGDSPFSNNEIQGGEADGVILIGVILGIVVLAVVGGINWALIRRFRLPSAAAKGGIVLVTAGLLVAPALVIF